MSNERFGIALNLKRIAASQYRNFNFNSMCVFNGRPLACNDEGIFSLDDAETDNGEPINFYVEFPTTDFGSLGAKRFRKLYLGYETSGSVKFTVKIDGNEDASKTLTPSQTGQIQHRDSIPMSRAQKGVYWIFKIENVHGCDLSLDNLEGLLNRLTKGRK